MSLTKRNAHSGVVRLFKEMLALEAKGCALDPNDYRLAAQAARATGDIGSALEWFDKAGASTDASDLRSRFAQVDIKEKKGDLTKDGGAPFPSDERAALALATAALKSSGKFAGYLPVGTYKLGSKTFEAKAGAVTKL